jgi:Bifunctional DNA primase/polymerase, N-terminal
MPITFSPNATARQAIVAAALALAAEGRAVFPMTAAKRPTCRHGVKDATTDPQIILELFRVNSAVLVAVATGTPSGISVLDVDQQHGGLTWWSANRDRLPPTLAYRSRSGGLHAWFVHRPGLRTCILADGVERRAEGASAIYWPASGLPVLCDAPPAPWPEWLAPPPPPAWTPPVAASWQGDDRRARRYAEAALRRGIEAVAGAAPGTRNAALNKETYALLRLAEAGGTSPGEVAEAMAHAGLAAGLPVREVQATLTSAIRARGARA